MNEAVKKAEKFIKNPKIAVVLGFAGIALIFLSSMFSGKERQETVPVSEYSAEQYCQELETRVERLVERITGDKNPTVVITVEGGKSYEYADATEYSSSTASGDKESENANKTYITVRTADGGEQALIVSETMPKVRGVAIVCNGGEDAHIAESIENAVTAALDITSKRVYIAGGKQ